MRNNISGTGEGARVFGENSSDLRDVNFSMQNSPIIERFKIKIDFSASLVTGGGLRSRIEELRSCYDPRCVAYFEDIQSKRKSAFCDSASGFMLLDSLLQKNKIDRLKTAILLDSHGRPYIDDPELDFSVSHSEGCAICVLAMGEGAAVGCDVQRARRYSEERLTELAATFMTDDELILFKHAPDKTAYFFTKWTRREAYVKRVGADIFDNLKSADISGEFFREGVITACGERYFYSINTLPLDEGEETENEFIGA